MAGHELAMTLRAAYLALHRQTNSLMAPLGVTADQFVVLAALSEGEALTQRDLVDRTSSDPNTLRAMLVLLEGQQLIQRRPHPTDGRARSVSLTRKGRSRLRSLWRETDSLRMQMVTALSESEVSTLVMLLKRLEDAINPDETSRAPQSGPRTSRHSVTHNPLHC